MNNSIRYLIVFLLFFLGENVSSFIHIDSKVIMVSIFILCMIVLLLTRSYKNRNLEIVAVLFIALYTFYKIKTDGGAGSRMIGFTVLLPFVILLVFPVKKVTMKQLVMWKKLGFLCFTFYLVECLIAIFERFTYHLVFRPRGEILNTLSENMLEDAFGFRSGGIHGHPLQNSLIVSIIMIFILTSSLKAKFKYPLWLLGYIGVMCFNTRAAIVINGIFFLLYVVYQLFIERRYRLFFISLSVVLFASYLLLSTELGGRLITTGLFDGSAEVRINIWTIFDYYTLSDFLLGINYDTFQLMKHRVGLYATENFYLDWTFLYGLLFSIPVIIFLILIVRKNSYGYKKMDALFAFLLFILIASTNNSLSSTFFPLSIFLFCLLLFNPLRIKYWVSSRFLSK